MQETKPTQTGENYKKEGTTPKPSAVVVKKKPQTAYRPGMHRPFRPGTPGTGFVRVRLPKAHKREVIGVIEEHFGSKLLVKCVDGHTRVCRIPGKIRYKLRVRIGNVVLVQKWVVQTDEKGDYLYRYTPAQVAQLKRKGFLKEEDLV